MSATKKTVEESIAAAASKDKDARGREADAFGDAGSDAGMTSSTAERDGEVTLDSIHRMLLLLANENAALRKMVEKQGNTILNLSEINSRTMLSNQRLIDEVTGLKGELKTALELVEEQRQAANEARALSEAASTESKAAVASARKAQEKSDTAITLATTADKKSTRAEASTKATESMSAEAKEASARAEEKAARAERQSAIVPQLKAGILGLFKASHYCASTMSNPNQRRAKHEQTTQAEIAAKLG